MRREAPVGTLRLRCAGTSRSFSRSCRFHRHARRSACRSSISPAEKGLFMSFSGFVVQLLNGLAGASSLFLVAAGLSLIFGVTRIVNFAHGSFFMVGIYVAYS